MELLFISTVWNYIKVVMVDTLPKPLYLVEIDKIRFPCINLMSFSPLHKDIPSEYIEYKLMNHENFHKEIRHVITAY